MTKITMKVKVNNSIFNNSWGYPMIYVWCKFGDSSSNPYNLSHRQSKFLRIPSRNVQNDLEGEGQWPPFSIPADSITGCMFGTNFVILTKICDELSWGQSKGQMGGRVNRSRQRQYAFGLKGHGVKMDILVNWNYVSKITLKVKP